MATFPIRVGRKSAPVLLLFGVRKDNADVTLEGGSSARARAWSTHRTRAPSRAKRIAAALPFPRPGPREPAPVTIATLPRSRSPMSRTSAVSAAG